MSKRVTGTLFCGIASFLFATRYIVAALLNVARFSGQQNGWGSRAMERFFSHYDGFVEEMSVLLICSGIALFVGTAYLIWGEYEEWTNHRSEQKEIAD